MRSLFCGREREMALLQAAWDKARNIEQPAPQLVVLMGESGLGKTRLVQEFYRWLSTTHDATEPAGYWPDDLGQADNNLKVNPDPSDCDNSEPMPFLWWGLRLNDPGQRNACIGSSVLSTYDKVLISHLNPVEKRLREVARQTESGIALASAMVDVGLSFIPGVGATIGLVKLAAEKCSELSATNRENKGDQQSISTGLLEQRELKSISDRILDGIEVLLKGASNTITATPACLLIDDAQFSEADPAVAQFVELLIGRAFLQKWPLMIIVTHWEAEWKTQWQSESGTVAAAIYRHQSLLGADWTPCKLGVFSQDDDLAPMLQHALSGLTTEQQQAILQRTGGNPRHLDEIIRLCRRCEHYFEDEELVNPLTRQGLEKCLNKSLRLHELIEERFSAMPKMVRRAVSLSSMQGQRFLTDITLEVAQLLALEGANDALHQAENPHSLINTVEEGIADFSQRIFHDIARQSVINEDKADTALRQVLRQRIKLSKGGESSDELSLAVAAELFETSTDKEDRRQAAKAMAAMIKQALERYDYATAHQISMRFVGGVEAGKWSADDLSFDQLWYVHDALLTMGENSAAFTIAETMREAAEQRLKQKPDDASLRMELGVAFKICGNMHKIAGDHLAAMQAFENYFEISKSLATELQTPEGRRDLAASYDRIGGMHQIAGDHHAAMQVFEKSLNICELLATELQTPGARRDLAVSYNKIGNMHKIAGDHQAAMQAFEKGLEISKSLATELQTPEVRRDLAVSYERIGGMHQITGDHHAAMQVFEKSLNIRELLATELQTPGARRDLSLSYGRIGGMHQIAGDHHAAMQAFEKSLNIRELLAMEINTPEARRDLAVSYDSIGGMHQIAGDHDAAMQVFEKSLNISELLATELQTPGARSDLAVSYDRIGDMHQIAGDHHAAMQVFEKSLNIRELLATEFNTFGARRDLAASYSRIGDIHQIAGDHHAAMQAFEKCFEISKLLAMELQTPEARRDLAVSYNKIGAMHQIAGDHDAAMQVFEKSLNIRELLATEFNTFGARRDLMVSFYKIASLNKSKNDTATALEFFQLALHQAKQYQSMAPCPDADQMVGIMTQEVERLNGSPDITPSSEADD